MTHTIAFFYADLGDPWWKTAVIEMIRSARRVMPGCKIIQLTDKNTVVHPDIDYVRGSEVCTRENLAEYKAYMVASFASQMKEPTVFCDADLIWIAKPPVVEGGWCAFDNTADALPWRQFLLQASPGHHDWLTSGLMQTASAMPPICYANDCFELALNFNIERLQEQPAAVAPEQSVKFAIHFPGQENRDKMIAYARSIDGGEQFRAMEPGYNPPEPKLTIPSAAYLASQGIKTGVNEDLTSISFLPQEPATQGADRP